MFGLFKKKKELPNESENSEKRLDKKSLKSRAKHRESLKGHNKNEKPKSLNKESIKESNKNIALKHNTESKKQSIDNKKQAIDSKKLVTYKEKPKKPSEPVSNYQAVMLAEKNDLQAYTVKQQEKLINEMQKRLLQVTKLTSREQDEFEKLYKITYVINHSKKSPEWLSFYDLLFIGEGHAVIISKFNASAGPLLSIEEIIKTNLKLYNLTAVFFKLEFIINQMIKMYNEGKNRNYHFKDSVRDLNNLGLIEKDLYKRLLFIAEIRSKVGRSWNVAEVKYQNSEGKVIKLKNKELEFKALLSEIYIDIVEIYMKVQEPYLHKFFLMWKANELSIGNPNSFYYI